MFKELKVEEKKYQDDQEENLEILSENDENNCTDSDSDPGDDELKGNDKKMLYNDINDAIN